MIFAVENIQGGLFVHVYADLHELSHSLEWQDVYGNAYRIVDELGVIYQWDSSKRTEEFAALYGYSLVANGVDLELGKRCAEQFFQESPNTEFVLK